MTEITLNTLKLHSERLDRLIDQLEDNFGNLTIHPKMSSEDIMYKAGQKNVVDYIKSIMDDT